MNLVTEQLRFNLNYNGNVCAISGHYATQTRYDDTRWFASYHPPKWLYYAPRDSLEITTSAVDHVSAAAFRNCRHIVRSRLNANRVLYESR